MEFRQDEIQGVVFSGFLGVRGTNSSASLYGGSCPKVYFVLLGGMCSLPPPTESPITARQNDFVL